MAPRGRGGRKAAAGFMAKPQQGGDTRGKARVKGKWWMRGEKEDGSGRVEAAAAVGGAGGGGDGLCAGGAAVAVRGAPAVRRARSGRGDGAVRLVAGQVLAEWNGGDSWTAGGPPNCSPNT